MPIETPIAVFLGLCCALFCLEAVVNPRSGSRGMEFQDHVSRAANFLHSKPDGQIFTSHSSFPASSHICHRFSFDVPPLFLSVFKDESRLLNNLHLALPAKLQVTNVLCAVFLLHLDKAQNLWTLFLQHVLAAFSRLRGRLFFVFEGYVITVIYMRAAPYLGFRSPCFFCTFKEERAPFRSPRQYPISE
jgi:hypothetical protein